MKKLALLLLPLSIFAKPLFHTLKSDFSQTIINDQNKTIKYYGKLLYKAPDKLRWQYDKPIKKEIVIKKNKMIIIEPDLEQITIRYLKNPPTFTQILKNAKKRGNQKYEGIWNGQKYIIEFNKKAPKIVSYQDSLGNHVRIEFKNPKVDQNISDSSFDVTIDPDFDVVYEDE